MRLGMTRCQIRQEMEATGLSLEFSRNKLDYYYESSIQVESDENGCASFIGVASNQSIELIYKGCNLFALSAREVYDLISRHEGTAPADYSDAGCLFPEQIISLWEADEQYDYYHGERTPAWGQIGVGNESYLAAIRKLQN